MRMKLGLFFGLCLLALSGSVHAAYDDVIELPQTEVFEAAKIALKDLGLKKADPEAGYLQSKWNQDKVIRSRGLLRGIVRTGYLRRYRIHVYLFEEENATRVKVKGAFQERSSGTDANIPWHSVKIMAADHRIERDVFFKILTAIENSRKENSTTV